MIISHHGSTKRSNFVYKDVPSLKCQHTGDCSTYKKIGKTGSQKLFSLFIQNLMAVFKVLVVIHSNLTVKAKEVYSTRGSPQYLIPTNLLIPLSDHESPTNEN